jgi:hypothetical protein
VSIRTSVARHRGVAGFVAGVSTAAVLGSGVALAAIPSTATGSITGCVSRSSGAVRIIDFQAGKRCSSRERTILWNKGYRYRGAWSARATYAVLDVVSYAGSSYLARVPSTAKTPTQTAYWGLLALHGAAGPRGTTGARGPAGPAGPAGPEGPMGLMGQMGPDGMDGVDGRDGIDGTDGVDGIQGPMGEQGPAGEPGPAGPQGPAGPAALLGYEVVTMTFDLPANSHTVMDPKCPSGKVPIAGGAHVGTNFNGWANAEFAYIPESDLDLAGTGWASTVVTTANADPSTRFVAHVICVSAGS